MLEIRRLIASDFFWIKLYCKSKVLFIKLNTHKV